MSIPILKIELCEDSDQTIVSFDSSFLRLDLVNQADILQEITCILDDVYNNTIPSKRYNLTTEESSHAASA